MQNLNLQGINVTTLESALMAGIAAVSTALVTVWRFYNAREERQHDRHKCERTAILAELAATRSEFTAVLLELSGIGKPKPGDSADSGS